MREHASSRESADGSRDGSRSAASRTRKAEQAPVDASVHETLCASGLQLDRSTRAAMELRFGYDFSRVRVHCDERAAQSADSVDALAYTVGNDIAFGRRLYQPNTATGRALLAHELAHVTQHGGRDPAAPVAIGSLDDPAEREADAIVSQAFSARTDIATHSARSGAPRRPSTQLRRWPRRGLLRGLRGVASVVGGALLGGLLGGPVGLLVGGGLGFAAGSLSSRGRGLTEPEIASAHEVYGDSIEYGKVTVTRGSVWAIGSTKTIGNTIHFRDFDEPEVPNFVGDTMELTDAARETLSHEIGHVWQYQQGGIAYIPRALRAQFRSTKETGNRNAAYDWTVAYAKGDPWEKWNPEQQATAMADYSRLLRAKTTDGAVGDDPYLRWLRARLRQQGVNVADNGELMSLLAPMVEQARRGEGAPGSKR